MYDAHQNEIKNKIHLGNVVCIVCWFYTSSKNSYINPNFSVNTFWRVSNTFFKYAISVIIHHIPANIWCFLSFEKFSPCFDSKTLAFYMKSTKVYWIWFKLTSFSRSDMYACCWVWWMYVIEKKLWILLIHSHKIQLECLQCVKSFRSTLFAHGIGAHQVENQHAFTKVILTNNSTAFT